MVWVRKCRSCGHNSGEITKEQKNKVIICPECKYKHWELIKIEFIDGHTGNKRYSDAMGKNLTEAKRSFRIIFPAKSRNKIIKATLRSDYK